MLRYFGGIGGSVVVDQVGRVAKKCVWECESVRKRNTTCRVCDTVFGSGYAVEDGVHFVEELCRPEGFGEVVDTFLVEPVVGEGVP